MVAQGEAKRNPGVSGKSNSKPRRGDRTNGESFCRPYGATFYFALRSQGFARFARFTLGYQRSPLRG
jgi:hypothetical protein